MSVFVQMYFFILNSYPSSSILSRSSVFVSGKTHNIVLFYHNCKFRVIQSFFFNPQQFKQRIFIQGEELDTLFSMLLLSLYTLQLLVSTVELIKLLFTITCSISGVLWTIRCTGNASAFSVLGWSTACSPRLSYSKVGFWFSLGFPVSSATI